MGENFEKRRDKFGELLSTQPITQPTYYDEIEEFLEKQNHETELESQQRMLNYNPREIIEKQIESLRIKILNLRNECFNICTNNNTDCEYFSYRNLIVRYLKTIQKYTHENDNDAGNVYKLNIQDPDNFKIYKFLDRERKRDVAVTSGILWGKNTNNNLPTYRNDNDYAINDFLHDSYHRNSVLKQELKQYSEDILEKISKIYNALTSEIRDKIKHEEEPRDIYSRFNRYRTRKGYKISNAFNRWIRNPLYKMTQPNGGRKTRKSRKTHKNKRKRKSNDSSIRR